MGYHPGFEDGGIYLTAVKSDLNPALYPHDPGFFRLQLQATFFDKWVAGFVRLTGIPLAATELFWHFAAIVLILFACWSIASKLFSEVRAQWAGVALVSAMFTLPVAGTALYLVDQHLHPRALATGLILLAVSRILAGKKWQAVPLLLLAFFLHPIMAAMGISFCFFLTLTTSEFVYRWLRIWQRTRFDTLAIAFVPLGWMFEPPLPRGGRLWSRTPTSFFTDGSGMSGWALWFPCFFLGCSGGSPEGAVRHCLHGLRLRFSSSEPSSRPLP